MENPQKTTGQRAQDTAKGAPQCLIYLERGVKTEDELAAFLDTLRQDIAADKILPVAWATGRLANVGSKRLQMFELPYKTRAGVTKNFVIGIENPEEH